MDKKRYKILYIETAQEVGGSVFSLYYLVKALNRNKYEPIILFHYHGAFINKFNELDIPIHIIETQNSVIRKIIQWSRIILTQPKHSKICKYFAAACYQLFETIPSILKLITVIKQNEIDLVHLNDQLRGHKAGIIAVKLTGTPVICHQRMVAKFNCIDLAFAKWVKKIICISRFIQETVKSEGINEQQTVLVYNGLDLDEWMPEYENNDVKKQDNELVVGTVGRLAMWKGQRYFIQAMAKAVQITPNIKGVVIGGDDFDDSDYAVEVRQRANDLGLSNKVIFTGFKSDMPKIMASLDVIVHCSTRPEPFGRVIIEGMALEKAIIGTSIGAIPELIEDGISGLLVAPGDSDSLADALIKLAQDKMLLKSLGNKARERVLKNFNIIHSIAQIEDVYEHVLMET